MQQIEKELLRSKMKQLRKKTENKEEKDKKIFENLISLPEFVNAKTVLVYASLDGEISTDSIIEYALSACKTVAVPVCSDEKGRMDFYVITALSELKKGSFGIREPNPEQSRKVSDFSGSLLVVPALCYDRYGYRLGYGGGYYDRFMKNFSSISAGLCYNKSIINNITKEIHDKPVNIIITESEIYYCNGGKNG